MEIHLLAINVGNSRLAIGAFIAGSLGSVKRISHEQRADWPAIIAEAWMPLREYTDAVVVGASVNPVLNESLEHAVLKATGRPIQWIGSDVALPIKVKTENPSQTGIDRVLNIAAAHEQMGKACAVVDAGSAITVDCCNEAGEFLGGAIAPGVTMQIEALHQHTAALPKISLEAPKELVGRSTTEAIRHGVYHGVRGMVKEVVENFATELGTWPDLIATGGDSPVLFEGWELVHAVAPDLTMYGIALAYAEHVIHQNP
jgi:type III pantothenate kinase